LFLQRTRDIATMTRQQAEIMGVLGPTARASNVKRDVRVDAPYLAYRQFSIHMVLEERGDLEARFVVRLKELFESFRLVREILANLPEGELTTRMPRRIKEGETISRVEAPRGELIYFLKSNGSDIPARVKVRTPTIMNMTSVVKLAVGHQLADIPMIVSGIDPCFSCNDRMAVVNNQDWNWAELRKYGIDYYRMKKAK
jgi:ech hydrogenase subunit E